MEREGVVHGEWHTCYALHSTLYRDPQGVGSAYGVGSPYDALRGERATPMSPLESSGVMLSLRQPDLWEQRYELIGMVERYKLARGGGAGGGGADEAERNSAPLSLEEWRAVLTQMATQHDPSWLEIWAFSRADEGKLLSITGDRVKVWTGADDTDGQVRSVRWDGAWHHGCTGRIVQVDEQFNGVVRLEDVTLEDGSTQREFVFQNPELEDLGAALRSAIKKAERILLEAQNGAPSVLIEPDSRAKLDDWAVARVTLPTVHVRGRFVLWQKGRPSHLVYPTLARYMTHFPVRQLLSHHLMSKLPRELSDAPEDELGPTVLLVIEAVAIEGLNTMMQQGSSNPYLCIQLGTRGGGEGVAQRLLTQPVIGGQSRVWYDEATGLPKSELRFRPGERFLVFFDGLALAQHDALEKAEVPIELTLMHKEANALRGAAGEAVDDGHGEGGFGGAGVGGGSGGGGAVERYGSIGGPPGIAGDLDVELRMRIHDAILAAIHEQMPNGAKDWQAAKDARRSGEGVMGGLMSAVFGGSDGSLHGEASVESLLDPSNQEASAPTDPALGHGKLDIGSDLRGTQPREVRVPLTLPMDQALHAAGLSERLTSLLSQRLGGSADAAGGGASSSSQHPQLTADEILAQMPEEMQRLSVPVGTVLLKLATARWSDASLGPSRRAQVVPDQTDIIAHQATDKRAAATVGAKDAERSAQDDAIGDGHNPYALKLDGSFLQYRWEESDLREVDTRLKGLQPVLAREHGLGDVFQRRADNLKARVKARETELTYAAKRSRELRLLDELAHFIRERYDDRGGQDRNGVSLPGSALVRLDDEVERRRKEEDAAREAARRGGRPMDPTERLAERLKLAHYDAAPTAEDLQSLEVVDEILQWEEYVVRLWEDGFRNALSFGDLSANEYYLSIQDDIARLEETLGQGQRQHWEAYRRRQWEARDMEAEYRRDMEKLYNAMLRRYGSVRAVSQPLENALIAMLPMEYRMSRAINKVRIGYWFECWRLLPADWQRGGARTQTLLWGGVGGRGGRARNVLTAEVFDTSGISPKQLVQMTREASNVGPAWKAPHVAQREHVDSERRAAVFADESSGGCRDIERCLARLRDMREKVESILDKEEGLPPPREPAPVITYHVSIKTASGAPSRVASTGALMRLVLDSGYGHGAEYTQELALGHRNRIACLPPDATSEVGGGGGGGGGGAAAKASRRGGLKGATAKGRSGGAAGAGSANGGGGGGAYPQELFRPGYTDVFTLSEFDRDLREMGDLVGLELATNEMMMHGGGRGGGSEGTWTVESVTISRAPATGVAWASSWQNTRIGSGRAWHFEGHTVQSGGGGGGGRAHPQDAMHAQLNWGPTPVGGTGWSPLQPQMPVHVVVRLGETSSVLDLGGGGGGLDLLLTLEGAHGQRTRPIRLGELQPLTRDPSTRHYVMLADGHSSDSRDADDRGTPLYIALRDGLVGAEVCRPANSSAPPLFLDSISVWCQSADSLVHFPCYEWLDAEEAKEFVRWDAPGRHGHEEAAETAGATVRRRLVPRTMHLGMPPPPPQPPSIEIRADPASPAHQLLAISCSVSSESAMHSRGWSGLKWRVQCALDASGLSVPLMLDFFDDETGEWVGERDGGILMGHAVLEKSTRHLRVGAQGGGGGGLPPGHYLWRCAAIHPVFGEGPFSFVARYEIVQGEGGALSAHLDTTLPGLSVTRPRPTPLMLSATTVRHAISFAPLSDYTSSGGGRHELFASGVRAPPVLREEAQLGLLGLGADGHRAHAYLSPVTFEEAVSPTVNLAEALARVDGGDGTMAHNGLPLRQLLHCVGDAEVWRGALELTPLRKGIGISGGAWFCKPLCVADGFETEFRFCVNTPRGQQRGSDGFAFVLQRDARMTSALGASGIQLGYGGLEGAIAVQFCTTPSCAPHRKRYRRRGEVEDDDDDSVLCTLPEPHEQIFLVPLALAGKECVCPFTGVHFLAPMLNIDEYGNERPISGSGAVELVDLSHHTDRIAVQSAGSRGASSGPEACLASAALSDARGRPILLDDGEEHVARIVLERNRFRDPRLAAGGGDYHAEEDDGHGGGGGGGTLATAPTAAGSAYRLLVYVDDMQNALINIEIELRDLFDDGLQGWDGRMTAGFTAGTGKTAAGHTIKSWSFYESAISGSGSTHGKQGANGGSLFGGFFS